MAHPSGGSDQTRGTRRQRYASWQRLRASLYGRLSLFVESLAARYAVSPARLLGEGQV